MKFTLALAQIDPVLGDLRKNVDKHAEAVERARSLGAALVVFPELSLTGYTVRDMNMDLAINPLGDSSVLKPLIDLSRNGISIIAGGIEEGAEYGIYNSAFLFEDGLFRSVHRKVYLPTYGMFEEMRYFSSGKSVKAIDTRVGRIGVLICEDLWHISLPYLAALDGAELIVGMVASPTRVGPDEPEFNSPVVNTENHRVYARLLSVYLAFCNRVGYEDGVNFWGGSQLIEPDGDVVARGKLFEEDLVLTEVDDNAIRRARRVSRHFLDENPELVIRELTRMRL
jgi:predicted amidohydrolase